MSAVTHEAVSAVTIEAYGLAAHGLIDPRSLATARPTLSWKFRAPASARAGTALAAPTSFRVQAAFSRQALERGDVAAWDTGWLPGDDHFVAWAGAPLASRSRVYWRVAVGSDDGVGPWSEVAQFELALLDTAEWTSQWVTHPLWTAIEDRDPVALPVIAFRVPAIADGVRARLYVAAVGVFTVQIDGQEITDEVLAPGYSRYSTRIGARAYDVTRFVSGSRDSEVTIGLGTGTAYVSALEGRYSKFVAGRLAPRVLAQLEVVDESGALHRAGTDASSGAWLGATTLTHWFGGEDFDARRELDAHLGRGAVAVLGEAALHVVWWPQYPAIGPVEHLAPARVTRTARGRIYDFGTNSAGVPTVRLTGASSGTVITIRPAELLAGTTITQSSTGSPIWDTYITRDGDQHWQPRYVYHGFRYLLVEGLQERDPDDAIAAVVQHARNQRVGDFSCSDPGFTKLHAMIIRALESNMFSVFTDCPHREKLGWLEEIHLCLPTMVGSFDLRAHLRDTVQHIVDAQLPDGRVPNIAPEFVDFSGNPHGGDQDAFRFDPNWGSALVHVPWGLYETYEDDSALRLAWPAIVRYLERLRLSETSDGLLDFGLGDWIAPDQSTPRVLAASHGYARLLAAAARIAHVMADPDRERRWLDKAAAVRRQLGDRMSDDGLSWGTDNQGSLALALDAGLVRAPDVPVVLARLLARIEEDGYAMTVGEIALPALIRVLVAHGRDDVLARLVVNVHGAGYGHQIASDSTTLAEAWDFTNDPDVEGSQNHFMLGMIDDWLRRRVAGLAQAPGSVGWRRVVLDPAALDGVSAGSIRFDSPRGEIVVDWDTAADGSKRPRISLPPGVTLEPSH